MESSSAAQAQEDHQGVRATGAPQIFQQQVQPSQQNLMRYHSAPGSLLCSLMDAPVPLGNSQAQAAAQAQQEQQQSSHGHHQIHHPQQLDMNTLSSININMSISGGGSDLDHHHQQQQPNTSSGSSMQSVTLARMGSIESGSQYDDYEAPGPGIIPLTFRVAEQLEAGAPRRAPAGTGAAHHHFLSGGHFDHPASHQQFDHHHHHHHQLHQENLNLRGPASGHQFVVECAAGLLSKQNSSPADLLSKLVEGMQQRPPPPELELHHHHHHQLHEVDQHLHLNPVAVNPIPAANAAGLLSPRSGSDGRVVPGPGPSVVTVDHPIVSSAAGPINEGSAGMWDDGSLIMSMHDVASGGRKRMREGSEVVEQQQHRFTEEMAYCDEEQCGMEHPALVLSRHLNLARNELQDSVPCKLRARRGCATHPRSVAERVRRTKISEGIKRLHDLVPNMDKQTNTADMLNHAMEYMKQLKEQIEQLQEENQRCKQICQGKCNSRDPRDQDREKQIQRDDD